MTMSNARKLQTEIDRVLKKVDEGVELFDGIWEKVYSAEQQNQKEKYEVDLKKEIKKLQRLRDQIKTWISSNEVKDKDAIIEARKLIETKMEQFKICEKETKTKTYSKEGLAREEKLDPAEEAKLNTTTWIQEYIERLQGLVEDADFEIERLSSGKGKKTNKHQIELFQQYIANHKFHINKLEGISRLVNNDMLDVEQVDPLKDDLDYYLDSFKEEEYQQAYDEDMFYEALGLEELDVVNVDRVTQTAAPPTKKPGDDAASSSSKGSKDRKASSKKSTLSSVIPLTIGRARTKGEKTEEKPTPTKATRSSSVSAAMTTTGKDAPPSTSPPAKAASPAPVASTTTTAHQGASMAAILKRETEQQEKERQKAREKAAAEQLRQEQQQQAAAAELQRQQEALRQHQQQQQEALKREQQLRQQQEAVAAAAAKQQAQQATAATAAETAAGNNGPTAAKDSVAPVGGVAAASTASSMDILSAGLGGLGIGSMDRNVAQSAFGAGMATAAVAAAPLQATSDSGSAFLPALTDSFSAAPTVMDQDRSSRQYTPQNLYPTPASYPATPSPIFDNPAVFEKLGTDCLFFIFYYAQGTYQQYLAARELKKQSWRFHKKYMTWFQRHEEPKLTTDEYEQGTYVYFDYETGWCTRIKQDFRFEYSYLEDSLQ